MRKTYTDHEYKQLIQTTEIVGDKHHLLILFELLQFGEKSFNELRRMTNINQVTLSRKLLQLKAHGLVDAHSVGKEHHYEATRKAQIYVPVIEAIDKLARK